MNIHLLMVLFSHLPRWYLAGGTLARSVNRNACMHCVAESFVRDDYANVQQVGVARPYQGEAAARRCGPSALSLSPSLAKTHLWLLHATVGQVRQCCSHP